MAFVSVTPDDIDVFLLHSTPRSLTIRRPFCTASLKGMSRNEGTLLLYRQRCRRVACREDGSYWSTAAVECPLIALGRNGIRGRDSGSYLRVFVALHAAFALHAGESALRLLLLLFNCSHTNLEPLALIFFYFFFLFFIFIFFIISFYFILFILFILLYLIIF